ncbi:hypothetical protein HHL14_32035 [Paraburkholderia sp. G-4-1-8]|uniref:Uncharacterized protein n=1 Tax=Paraburkholderia antibiotica TaxID=2728839 RepID=A0A7Y0A2T1_9BURK|nr:hypothetical protein [Paraburkholderia antibiotica]
MTRANKRRIGAFSYACSLANSSYLEIYRTSADLPKHLRIVIRHVNRFVPIARGVGGNPAVSGTPIAAS